MICNSRTGTTVLWNSLIGVTFLVCSLLIYHFVIHDPSCSLQSGCSKMSKHTAEKLLHEECDSVCTTNECIYISNYILNHLDQTVDPCTNFYKFACGKFIDQYETHANYSFFMRAIEGFYAVLRDVIESSNEPYGTAMYKLKVVYDSCMNTGASELRDIETLLSFLGHMGLSNWPRLSSNFSFVNPQFPELLGKLITYDEPMFFDVGRSLHDDDDQANNFGAYRNISLSYSSSHYSEEDFERAFKRILHRLGLDFNSADVIWKDFKTIENSVAELRMKVYDMEETYETIKCQDEKSEVLIFVCKIVESVVRNGRLTSLFHRDQLHLEEMSYAENMYAVITNYTDRVIANYIATRLFIKNWPYMNFWTRKSYKLFHILGYDEHIQLDQVKYCIDWTVANFPLPLGAIYVDKMWSPETENEVKNIVQELINTIADTILRQKWIGDSAKEEFVKEVLEQESTIHYVVQEMRNKTKINMRYKRFNPSRTSFLRNVMFKKKLDFARDILPKEEKVNLRDLNPFVVNAYGGGYIYLTFGILSPPFFKHNFPKLFNLAKIGYITGHEIGHTSFMFLEDSSHVDNDTREHFREKASCLIDQYFKFEQKSIKKFVQGNQTVSENFPDNMSLKVVEKIIQAYLRNVTSSGFSLPRINYSPEELFYIFYAQTWCEVRSAEKQLFHNERDLHSPPEYRIIGALQNSIRFSEVFNCSRTSYMNPQEKCIIFE